MRVSGNMTIYSEEEAYEEIQKLLERYPILEEIELDEEEDCPCCVANQIGYTYGWDIKDAWDELMDWYYLLGRKP